MAFRPGQAAPCSHWALWLTSIGLRDVGSGALGLGHTSVYAWLPPPSQRLAEPQALPGRVVGLGAEPGAQGSHTTCSYRDQVCGGFV